MIAAGKKIRVLVVDDSLLARSMITKGLSAHPRIEIVGFAINTMDARRKISALNPDVVTMDVEMPGQNGIEFLKEYLPTHPIPTILVSSLNLKVFDALAAGAVDFVRKPTSDDTQAAFITALAQKVLVASMSRVRVSPSSAAASAAGAAVAATTPSGPAGLLGASPALNSVVIGLGASTGGTEATLEVMKRLPADIPPMVIVQHMPKGFTEMYANRLNNLCQMEVREAKNGDELRRGLALVAPADLQARLVRIGDKYTVSCTPGEKVSGHRPSVDALFQSMSEVVRCKMVGIIMTGMGQDGAAGLLAMRRKGAYTIGQDQESCVVYGMPKVAYDIGAVCTQAPCEGVAGVLLRHLKSL
nr:chemotaxis response regulator protein-glutamate methylesterase [uncultured Oscillibacter sp.]